jgi:hypothetical protein
MLKEMYPEFKRIYDEAIAIELPAYVKGGENAEGKRFLELRGRYEAMVKSLDVPYAETKEFHAENYNIINMRGEIDRKLKNYIANAKNN